MRFHYRMELRNKLTKDLVDIVPSWPQERVEQFFADKRTLWKTSNSCSQLKRVLQSVNIQHRVTKVIGLACSTMSQHTDESSAQPPAYQHALILSAKDFLLEKYGDAHRISFYVQDPAYNSVDTSVLQRYGISTLVDPKAFLEIDTETLLVSCSPNVAVKQIVADIALPSVIIWDRVTGTKIENMW
jgi:hypothetical protein